MHTPTDKQTIRHEADRVTLSLSSLKPPSRTQTQIAQIACKGSYSSSLSLVSASAADLVLRSLSMNLEIL